MKTGQTSGGFTVIIPIYIFGIELAQMKLDEFAEDFMNLDVNKESMDDNRSHSQD